MIFAPVVFAVLAAQRAQPASPATPPAPLAFTFFARNTTRVESWRYFEPHPGGGDPDYAFVANRLQFGVRHASRRWEFVGAGQYVQFGNLPEHASGPGPLGTGAGYFSASADTASHQVYLKYAALKLKGLAPGLDVQGGRFAYTSGAEAPSGVPKIEAVKRSRVDSRLIGEFEWSLYQRSFDGARVDWRRGAYQLTGAWLRPTQGGFEEDANVHMARVNVEAATLSVKPGAWLPRTDTQLFMYRYDDTRAVRARPDNTGRSAAAVDIGITTIGASLASALPAPGGEIDTLLWSTAQFGDWYGDDHAAWAIAAEAGYQWSAAPWKPWVRGGVNRSSGDDDPADNSHGTFFQMLPTARKYALSAVYTQMNLRDVFAQVMMRPRPALSLRVDLHRLDLAAPADRWYFGSGAMEKSGTTFGYGARSSGGARALGTIVEGSAEYAVGPHWTVGAYAGRMAGGDVVDRLFANDRLTFAYVESLIRF